MKKYYIVTNPTATDKNNSVQASGGNTSYIQSIVDKYHILSPVGSYVFSTGVELTENEVAIFAEGRLCQDWSLIGHKQKHLVRNYEREAGREMVDELESNYDGISDIDAVGLLTKVREVKLSLESGYLSLALYQANLLTTDPVFTQPHKDEVLSIINAYFVKLPHA